MWYFRQTRQISLPEIFKLIRTCFSSVDVQISVKIPKSTRACWPFGPWRQSSKHRLFAPRFSRTISRSKENVNGLYFEFGLMEHLQFYEYEPMPKRRQQWPGHYIFRERRFGVIVVTIGSQFSIFETGSFLAAITRKFRQRVRLVLVLEIVKISHSLILAFL